MSVSSVPESSVLLGEPAPGCCCQAPRSLPSPSWLLFGENSFQGSYAALSEMERAWRG